MRVDIHVDDTEVRMQLDRLEDRLGPSSLAQFLSTVASEFFRERAGARFSGEGDDASGSWAALGDVTKYIRVTMGYGAGPINMRSGDLHQWVTASDGIVSPDTGGATLVWPGAESGSYMTEKYETAQAGRTDPLTVARPVVAANETDMDFLLSGLSHWIDAL